MYKGFPLYSRSENLQRSERSERARLVLHVLCLVLHVLCLVLHVLCLVLHVLCWIPCVSRCDTPLLKTRRASGGNELPPSLPTSLPTSPKSFSDFYYFFSEWSSEGVTKSIFGIFWIPIFPIGKKSDLVSKIRILVDKKGSPILLKIGTYEVQVWWQNQYLGISEKTFLWV